MRLVNGSKQFTDTVYYFPGAAPAIGTYFTSTSPASCDCTEGGNTYRKIALIVDTDSKKVASNAIGLSEAEKKIFADESGNPQLDFTHVMQAGYACSKSLATVSADSVSGGDNLVTHTTGGNGGSSTKMLGGSVTGAKGNFAMFFPGVWSSGHDSVGDHVNVMGVFSNNATMCTWTNGHYYQIFGDGCAYNYSNGAFSFTYAVSNIPTVDWGHPARTNFFVHVSTGSTCQELLDAGNLAYYAYDTLTDENWTERNTSIYSGLTATICATYNDNTGSGITDPSPHGGFVFLRMDVGSGGCTMTKEDPATLFGKKSAPYTAAR